MKNNDKMMVNTPSYISRYYANQSRVRGITSKEHVEYWEEKQSKIYNKLLFPYLKSYKKGKVVELACGPGIFMRYLLNKGFDKSIGVEFADEYVNLCLEQGLNVVKADAFDWLKSQPASSIDVIVAIDFIEHIDKENFVNFLDLISSVLSHNGLFIARCPCGDSPFFGLNFYNDITHETVFTTTALRALMTICNLNLFDVKDEYPASITNKNKQWLVPFVKLTRFIVRMIILASTGCYIRNLGPNMWIFAKRIDYM